MNHQRGAISIIAAATLVVAVLAVALALDIGRIVHERQRLQGAVDAAALAGARALAIENDPAGVPAAASAAANKNGYAGALTVAAGHMEVGTEDEAIGLRKFVAGPGSWYNAVQVEATRTVPRSLFAGGILPGTTNITNRAVAFRESVATFQVGTSLLEVSSQESALLNAILGGMLGTSLSLGIADYESLVAANVTLRELAARLDIGTTDELLAENISLGDLVSESIAILERREDAASRAAALTLNNYLLNLPGDVKLGEVLSVATGAAAADAHVNVFDLLMASAQLATSRNIAGVEIDLGNALTALNLGGIAGLDLALTVKVGEPPQIGVGPPGPPECGPDNCHAIARSAQIDLGVSAVVLNLINLKIDVKGAAATAGLERLDPPTMSSPTRVDVGTSTEAASIGLSGSLRLAGLTIPLLGLSTTLQGSSALHTFAAPFPTGTAESTTSRIADFQGLRLSVNLGPLALIPGLQGLVNSTIGALTGNLLGPLIQNVLAPLTKLLGLQIGGADVTVLHASAGNIRLVQ